MSTIEDFRNAPVGATATHADGGRAMKIDAVAPSWITPWRSYLSDGQMGLCDYTLDSFEPRPASVREALDLAWELAHEVKEGQVIPKGTRYISRFRGGGLATFTASIDWASSPRDAENIRTLDPLPDPETEPDWLDALVVLATCECRGMELWQPHNKKDGTWECAHCGLELHWSELVDVTPLYQNAGQDA